MGSEMCIRDRRRLVNRNSRPSHLSKDTSHTHSPCLPISGECTPQTTSGGQVEGEDGHHGQRSSLKHMAATAGSRGIFFECFVLTLMCFSPVYAVSAMFPTSKHGCLQLLSVARRDYAPLLDDTTATTHLAPRDGDTRRRAKVKQDPLTHHNSRSSERWVALPPSSSPASVPPTVPLRLVLVFLPWVCSGPT